MEIYSLDFYCTKTQTFNIDEHNKLFKTTSVQSRAPTLQDTEASDICKISWYNKLHRTARDM